MRKRYNKIIYVETMKGQQRMPYNPQNPNFNQNQPGGMGQNRMRKSQNISLQNPILRFMRVKYS